MYYFKNFPYFHLYKTYFIKHQLSMQKEIQIMLIYSTLHIPDIFAYFNKTHYTQNIQNIIFAHIQQSRFCISSVFTNTKNVNSPPYWQN